MKHFPKRFRTACLVTASTLVISACVGGGGGGGGGGSSPAVAAAVAAATAADAGVLLQWDAPTENTDGSTLRDTVAYRFNHGASPGSYSESKSVDLKAVDCAIDEDAVKRCSYRLGGLASGTWYVTVQAVASNGRLSAHSAPLTVNVE
ncbi:hypothetical protein [Alkalilimnicola sp. S0819]|uniref:hypothetical protein n=1 Tax=Alkalilimnicola sp. S0819 TaxID=2613922 RepID=UPI001261A198|nr:hypothetical protein [Alkalilimnicola sp. S0819]KAB7622867.1 hypothetical protein F3N43_11130 [Alkalilimnicola sp. S0819]MPQ17189.1 hypothetical protein [Alkalilimnicola sp. S0819]